MSAESGAGKSMSLRNLENPEGVMYLNCEAGKQLPFNAKFMRNKDGQVGFTITDPLQIYAAFDKAETMSNKECHSIVIDTATFMMEMYETVHVLTAEPKYTMQAWGSYANFFRVLMQQYVAKSTKNVIILAHAADIEQPDGSYKSVVKVKGSLMANGIEAYFSTVIMAKKVSISELKPNELLNITEAEIEDKYKHVFQTMPTKDDRIRAPFELFSRDEKYIDNDINLVIKRFHDYYV